MYFRKVLEKTVSDFFSFPLEENDAGFVCMECARLLRQNWLKMREKEVNTRVENVLFVEETRKCECDFSKFIDEMVEVWKGGKVRRFFPFCWCSFFIYV